MPLIGAPALARRYALTLATYGIRTQMLDTEKVTLAGLALIHSDISHADN
ncbi:MAG: hypothetical protein NVS3B27_16910 [Novosphingobium sp.]